jgi:hypothetical protein
MALCRHMGVTAPRESFARLFINDQYDFEQSVAHHC